MQMKSASKRTPTISVFLVVFLGTLLLAGMMAWAQEHSQVSSIPELAKAHALEAKMNSAMKEAEARGAVQAYKQARERHRVAERQMQQNLAHVAGVEPHDIAAMREAGMGWGQICQELGMHPGHLGLGPKDFDTPAHERFTERERNRARNREQMEATMRQMNNIGAPKHGMAAMSFGSHGLGLGMATDTVSHRSSRGFAGMSHGSDEHGEMGGEVGGAGSHGGGMGGGGNGGDGGNGGGGGHGGGGGGGGHGGDGGHH